MSGVQEYLVGTEEYVKGSVTLDETIDTETITLVIDGQDYPAQWTGTAAATRAFRTTDVVDFSDWIADYYEVRPRIGADPETPLISAGWIRVRN
jgi:hypothetical protein